MCFANDHPCRRSRSIGINFEGFVKGRDSKGWPSQEEQWPIQTRYVRQHSVALEFHRWVTQGRSRLAAAAVRTAGYFRSTTASHCMLLGGCGIIWIESEGFRWSHKALITIKNVVMVSFENKIQLHFWRKHITHSTARFFTYLCFHLLIARLKSPSSFRLNSHF